LLTLPIPVTRALRKLGHDIKDARRRRRIAMAIVAQRASVSKPTLIRVERGDPSVSIGSYATVLFVMGMADRLADLADAKNDPVGLQLEQEKLPKRIRGAQKPKAMKGK
jgi:transcriptional regulator with XRE-family HTH domain